MENEVKLTEEQCKDALQAYAAGNKAAYNLAYDIEDAKLAGIKAVATFLQPYLQPDRRQHDEELLDRYDMAVRQLEGLDPASCQIRAAARAAMFSKKPRYAVAVNPTSAMDWNIYDQEERINVSAYYTEAAAQADCDFLNSKEDSE